MKSKSAIVIIFHKGCHFRTRNGEYKRSCHESSIHIPLIIRGPGFTGGKKVDKLVTLLDLPPTIFAAVGTIFLTVFFILHIVYIYYRRSKSCIVLNAP